MEYLKKDMMLTIGVFVVAMNSRAPFTSTAPLLASIKSTFNLSTTQASIIQTMPLMVLAIFSPFIASLAKKIGANKIILLALFLIALGIILRSLAGLYGLYAGTLIIGLGITQITVLLPGILKKNLPGKECTLTSMYVLAMGLAAALGSATMIPLANNIGFGWSGALLFTIILPVLAIVLWLPQIYKVKKEISSPINNKIVQRYNVWTSGLAWQVSLFYGFNSVIYSIILVWLPAILQSVGSSFAAAGSLHGVLQLSTAISGFFIGPFLNKLSDYRVPGVTFALLGSCGLLGLLVFPSLATLWVIMIGISTGASVILGLTFIVVCSMNSSQADSLSGMCRCLGYTLSAGGPLVAGLIHDKIGGWALPLLLCIALSFGVAFLGYRAGRSRLPL